MALKSYLSNVVRSIMGKGSATVLPVTSNPVFGTQIIHVGASEVYANISVTNAIEKGFNANTAVYAIVMMGATKFGSIPRYLYDATKKEEKQVKGVERKAQPRYQRFEGDTDLATLINRPNPQESQDAFFTKVYAYLKVCGEAFIYLNRDVPEDADIYTDTSKMPVLEMYCLPPDKIAVVADPTDVHGVLYYRLKIGVNQDIRKTDMIHWKSTNLAWDTNSLDHLRGFPPLAAGSLTLEENNSMSKAAMRQAQNDGARGVLANKTLGARPTPQQQTQIKNVIDSKINSNNVSGQVAALEGDWAYLDLGRSAVDLDLRESKMQSWKELCALFATPYELFDPGTTYANKLQAQKGWVSNSILPACKQLDGELNRVLLIAFNLDKKVFIGSDCSDLAEMQIDMQAMATALSSAWWFTPNEKRETMGEEPYDDPVMDEIWPPSGTAPMSEQQANAEMDRELLRQGMNDNGGANNRTGGA